VLFCRSSRITVEELPVPLTGATAKAAAEPVLREAVSLQAATEQAEIEAIRAAFLVSHRRRAGAAELLGISRKTLWEKVKHYGIVVEAGPQSPAPALGRTKAAPRGSRRR